MISAGLRKWLAAGSGVGIQISGPRGAESMHVAAVRVRPGGAPAVKLLRGGFAIENFPQQPAGVWGTDYAAFLRKLGMRHVAATVVLPRQDVIVRPLELRGVSDNDLEGAVRFQMDGLHPYNDDDVFSSWVRLPGTSTALVAIARKEIVERYAGLFAEAGIKIRAFTCSAAAVYSALRLFGSPASREILAWDDSSETGGADFYGESPARPLLSASYDIEISRAAALAASELRIESQTQPVPLSALLGVQPAVAYAAALASACPRLCLSLNLLPAAMRQASSPLQWIPVGAAGVAVVVLAGALVAFPAFENRRFERSLQAQIAAVMPRADRAGQIDKEIAAAGRRIQLLDDLRRRPKADMDVLAELTRILPPPTWLNSMEILPAQVIVDGETDQAAPLLKVVDSSPLFESSEFQMGPVPKPGGAMFRIKTNRKNSGSGPGAPRK
jgi:hypothetical protein